jgi:DNA-directed RNA polymerase specialized sigma24 family protein
MNQPYYYVEGFIAKDRKIYEEFYQETKLTVFIMAYLILQDALASKSLMKDIYEQLVRKCGTYALGTSLSGWILSITNDVATRHYWEMVKKDAILKEKDELSRKLDDYLGSLNHDGRLVYLLHDVAGIQINTLKKHVHSGLLMLMVLENKAEKIVEQNSLMLGNERDAAPAEMEKIIMKYIPAEAPEVDLEGLERKEVNSFAKAAGMRLWRQVIWTGIMIILFVILIIVIAKA